MTEAVEESQWVDGGRGNREQKCEIESSVSLPHWSKRPVSIGSWRVAANGGEGVPGKSGDLPLFVLLVMSKLWVQFCLSLFPTVCQSPLPQQSSMGLTLMDCLISFPYSAASIVNKAI